MSLLAATPPTTGQRPSLPDLDPFHTEAFHGLCRWLVGWVLTVGVVAVVALVAVVVWDRHQSRSYTAMDDRWSRWTWVAVLAGSGAALAGGLLARLGGGLDTDPLVGLGRRSAVLDTDPLVGLGRRSAVLAALGLVGALVMVAVRSRTSRPRSHCRLPVVGSPAESRPRTLPGMARPGDDE